MLTGNIEEEANGAPHPFEDAGGGSSVICAGTPLKKHLTVGCETFSENLHRHARQNNIIVI
jgi:hypothetical protein